LVTSAVVSFADCLKPREKTVKILYYKVASTCSAAAASSWVLSFLFLVFIMTLNFFLSSRAFPPEMAESAYHSATDAVINLFDLPIILQFYFGEDNPRFVRAWRA
jgi:hypothetical protein